MNENTLYRIDNLDSASRITAKNWLIDEGVLVPVEPDDVTKEAILLVESILPTDYGWEETAGLRSALGIGGDE